MVKTIYACFAVLEGTVCDLYETMIDRTDNQVKLLLDKILQESKAHKELLTRMSGLSGPDMLPSTAQCNGELGEMFRDSMNFLCSPKVEVVNGLTVIDAARSSLTLRAVLGKGIQSRRTRNSWRKSKLIFRSRRFYMV